MENNQIKELGNKLVELRKNKGMTQTELAEEMFITHQAISQWENGLTIPDLGSLLKLCEIFNITLNDLFYLSLALGVSKNKKKLKKKYIKCLMTM